MSSVGGSATAGASSTPGGTTSTGGSSTAPTRVATCPVPAGAEMPEASTPAGYCPWVFAEGLSNPRGITTDDLGQLLLIEQGATAVTLLWDANNNRTSEASERLRIATAPGLNHGIAVRGGYVYASSDTTVYRWPYTGARTALANRETVVTGIPGGGNHVTRTLAFDPQGNLYLHCGSATNVDANSNRSRVVRFTAAQLAAGTTTWADATVFADGTRNEVGLRFDSQGRLWGVENGSDNLNRTDLGGDIHIDNPAEELNLFAQAGAFYGYPYCWSEGVLPSTVGKGPGTQWAYPAVMADGTHTDAWCQNPANVTVPSLSMQAHSAPLDVLFYTGGSFPADVVGDAIITFHGSWNRTPATGYKVVRAGFGANGLPDGTVTPLLESTAAGDTGGGWTHRPVGLTMGKNGEVYVTSDADGMVLAIGHNGT